MNRPKSLSKETLSFLTNNYYADPEEALKDMIRLMDGQVSVVMLMHEISLAKLAGDRPTVPTVPEVDDSPIVEPIGNDYKNIIIEGVENINGFKK